MKRTSGTGKISGRKRLGIAAEDDRNNVRH